MTTPAIANASTAIIEGAETLLTAGSGVNWLQGRMQGEGGGYSVDGALAAAAALLEWPRSGVSEIEALRRARKIVAEATGAYGQAIEQAHWDRLGYEYSPDATFGICDDCSWRALVRWNDEPTRQYAEVMALLRTALRPTGPGPTPSGAPASR